MTDIVDQLSFAALPTWARACYIQEISAIALEQGIPRLHRNLAEWRKVVTPIMSYVGGYTNDRPKLRVESLINGTVYTPNEFEEALAQARTERNVADIIPKGGCHTHPWPEGCATADEQARDRDRAGEGFWVEHCRWPEA